MKRFLWGVFFLLFSLFTISCGSKLTEATSVPITPTSTLTLSPTSTLTPSPTFTVTPTITPTPQLPVLSNTAIPDTYTLSIENTSQIEEIARLWGNPDSFAVLSRDKSRLIVANAEGIYIYNDLTNELIQRIDDKRVLMTHYSGGNSAGGWPIRTGDRNFLDVSANGDKIAFLSDDLLIYVIDDVGNILFSLPLDELTGKNYIYEWLMRDSYLKFSPDGKYLLMRIKGFNVSQDIGKTVIYDIQSNKEIDLGKLTYRKVDFDFSSDGKYLVSCCFGTSSAWKIFDTGSWGEIGEIIPTVRYNTSAVSPFTNTLIFLDTEGGEIELWDIGTQQLTEDLEVDNKVSVFAPRLDINKNELLIVSSGFDQFIESKLRAQVLHPDGSIGELIDSDMPETELVRQPFRVNSEIDFDLTGVYGSHFISIGRPTMFSRGGILHIIGNDGDYKVVVGDKSPDGYMCELSIENFVIDYEFSCPLRPRLFTELGYRIIWSDYFVDNENYYSAHTQGNKTVFAKYPGILIGEMSDKNISNYRLLDFLPRYNKVILTTRPGRFAQKAAIYDLQTGKIIATVPEQVNSFAFSNDQRFAAFASWREGFERLYIYDLGGDEPTLLSTQRFNYGIPEIRLNLQSMIAIQPMMMFPPDNKTLIVAFPFMDDSAKYGVHMISIDMNTPDQKLVRDILIEPLISSAVEIRGMPFLAANGYKYGWQGWQNAIAISAMAISSDNSLLAIGSEDGQLIIINANTGEVVEQLQAHVDNILGISFSDDLNLIATLSRSGIVKLWGVLR